VADGETNAREIKLTESLQTRLCHAGGCKNTHEDKDKCKQAIINWST